LHVCKIYLPPSGTGFDRTRLAQIFVLNPIDGDPPSPQTGWVKNGLTNLPTLVRHKFGQNFCSVLFAYWSGGGGRGCQQYIAVLTHVVQAQYDPTVIYQFYDSTCIFKAKNMIKKQPDLTYVLRYRYVSGFSNFTVPLKAKNLIPVNRKPDLC
jgi:hypothetical protein